MKVLPRVFYDELIQYYDLEMLISKGGIKPRSFACDIKDLKLRFEYQGRAGYLEFEIKTFQGVLSKTQPMPVNEGATFFVMEKSPGNFHGCHVMFLISADTEYEEYICLDSMRSRGKNNYKRISWYDK